MNTSKRFNLNNKTKKSTRKTARNKKKTPRGFLLLFSLKHECSEGERDDGVKKLALWRNTTHAHTHSKKGPSQWQHRGIHPGSGLGSDRVRPLNAVAPGPTKESADGQGLFLCAFLLPQQNGLPRQINGVSDPC